MGNLTVYIKTDDGVLHQIWRKSGNQNQGWKMDMIGGLNPSVPYQVIHSVCVKRPLARN